MILVRWEKPVGLRASCSAVTFRGLLLFFCQTLFEVQHFLVLSLRVLASFELFIGLSELRVLASAFLSVLALSFALNDSTITLQVPFRQLPRL